MTPEASASRPALSASGSSAHVRRACFDDRAGCLDPLGDILRGRGRTIIVRVLGGVAHLPHPLELAERVVVNELRRGGRRVPVSTADGPHPQASIASTAVSALRAPSYAAVNAIA